MTKYKIGDIVGECPGGEDDECKGDVIYNGGTDAVCAKCNSVYKITFEDGEEGEEEEVQHDKVVEPEIVEPDYLPRSAVSLPDRTSPEPVQPIIDDDIVSRDELGSLSLGDDVGDVVQKMTDPVMNDPETLKKALKLDENEIGVGDQTDTSAIPTHVKRSRAWRYAHVMCKTGNPYRNGTIKWIIFNACNGERTIEEIVAVAPSLGITKKLSYLLNIYEVLNECITSGLLVLDNETRIVSVCQEDPIPVILSEPE